MTSSPTTTRPPKSDDTDAGRRIHPITTIPTTTNTTTTTSTKRTKILSMKTTTTTNDWNWRSIYLSSLGTVFLIAFLSYHNQYPGLLSSAGLEPVDRIFPHAFPRIYEKIISRWIDSDSFCEFLMLFGVLLSSLVASGLIHHASLFLIITFLYSLLVPLGQTFYSFQWDILLLETGTVTALCYAPYLSLHSSSSPSRYNNNNNNNLGSWSLRYLLFKLMFMSGVVKIQANCPTWKQLTALEYHFATQCLPGPLAWFIHQLHPLVLRMGVAATFVIEIPAAFLLISPFATQRKIGAYLQIFLQVLIILTGNYNFFNLLTILLCFPCMEEDSLSSSSSSSSVTTTRIKTADDDDKMKGDTTTAIKTTSRGQYWMSYLHTIITTIFLYYSCTHMFSISGSSFTNYNINLKITISECNDFINKITPLTLPYTLTILSFYTLSTLLHHPRRLIFTLITYLTTLLTISLLTTPLLSLTPHLSRTPPPQPLPFLLSFPLVQNLQQIGHSYHLINGYGLFRRMTGVHPSSIRHPTGGGWGWGGLPPSIVARPEIVFQTSVSKTKDDWREWEFWYKPGSVGTMPRQIAPHQPRLDWQMWFAALGTYQHNPWFIHLVYKMLVDCSPVMDLMRGSSHLDKEKKTKKRIKRVRARLYDYDFTRIDTDWNRRIPGVRILEKDGTLRRAVTMVSQQPSMTTTSMTTLSLWDVMMQGGPDTYWTRWNEREYLFELDATNESLRSFLVQSGYLKDDGGKDDMCPLGYDRCRRLSSSSSRKEDWEEFFCVWSVMLREMNVIYGIVLWVYIVAVLLAVRNRWGRRRARGWKNIIDKEVMVEDEMACNSGKAKND